MTDNRVTTLLHGASETLPVGPPPIDAMILRVDRGRRRRVVVLGSGVAVALVVATVMVLGMNRSDGVDREGNQLHQPSTTAPTSPTAPTNTTTPDSALAKAASAAGVDCPRLLAVDWSGHDPRVNGFDSQCEELPLGDGNVAEYQPAMSPNGQQVVFIRKDTSPGATDSAARLILLNRSTGETSVLDTSPDTLGDPAFSPDGGRVAYWFNADGQAHLRVVNIATDGITQLTTGPVPDVWPAWNPQGTRIAYGHGAELAVVTVATHRVHVLPNTHGLKHPFWDPLDQTGGALLAIETPTLATTRIRYVNTQGNQPSATIPGAFNSVTYDARGIHVSTSPSLSSSTITRLDDELNVLGHFNLPGTVFLAAHP